ncbi:MAG TPA: hypothetical protein VFF28_05390 [Candidatus Nanoarchaeia archaeon]|nr:hypothetical protein [Candidatus Nanoarchaeia archaeon]
MVDFEDEQFTRLILNNLYRLGTDKINIQVNNIRELEAIHRLTTNNFLGFEITKESKDHCSIESVTEPHDEKYEILLRRIFLIIKDCLGMIEEDFRKRDFALNSIIERQFFKVEQFANFCMRTAIKNSGNKSSMQYLFVYDLLVMQGELKHMYEFIGQKGSTVNPKTMQLVKKIKSLFDKLYHIYFGEGFSQLPELNKELKGLLNADIYSLLPLLRGKEVVIVYHLAVFLRLLTLIISPAIALKSE